jgi:hypothetical protein
VCLETAKKGGRVPVEIRCVHYDLAQISRGSCGLLETWRDWPAVCCRSLQLQSRLSVSSPQQETSVCFITAGPITKLCAWGEEESGGHVL